MNSKNYWKSGALLILLLSIFFIADILIGSVHIPFYELLSIIKGEKTTYSDIIIQFRLPKALTSLLAGGTLATAGLMMQTLFRNPLAGPDVLGLTSGSSLMVAIMIFAKQTFSGLDSLTGSWSIAIGASLGGGLVFLLIIGIAQIIKDNATLLIIGLMISAVTSSLVSILQFVSKAEDLQTYVIWSFGNVGSVGWSELKVLALVSVIGILISLTLMKPLNGLLLGENYATGLGINIRNSRFWIVVSTGILTGAVTAFCGPIAFVGLAVPHLVRLIIPTTNHKLLIPAVMCGGASLLLLCDLLTQLPGSTRILPLNAITSLLGAPVIIWLILKSKKIHV